MKKILSILAVLGLIISYGCAVHQKAGLETPTSYIEHKSFSLLGATESLESAARADEIASRAVINRAIAERIAKAAPDRENLNTDFLGIVINNTKYKVTVLDPFFNREISLLPGKSTPLIGPFIPNLIEAMIADDSRIYKIKIQKNVLFDGIKYDFGTRIKYS